jgi:hypothetical protein
MGRKPWTSRLTVEECLALDVNVLAHDGAFENPNGSWMYTFWPDKNGIEQFRVGFQVTTLAGGQLILHVHYDADGPYSPAGYPVQYAVKVISTPCRFGGKRYWFLCPLAMQGRRCGRKVARLYLPPGQSVFGCRLCHDLTYTSTQTHDARASRLAKNAELLSLALQSSDLRQQLLALKACSLVLPRSQRKLQKDRARA